jgi:hypothetical protein
MILAKRKYDPNPEWAAKNIKGRPVNVDETKFF